MGQLTLEDEGMMLMMDQVAQSRLQRVPSSPAYRLSDPYCSDSQVEHVWIYSELAAANVEDDGSSSGARGSRKRGSSF